MLAYYHLRQRRGSVNENLSEPYMNRNLFYQSRVIVKSKCGTSLTSLLDSGRSCLERRHHWDDHSQGALWPVAAGKSMLSGPAVTALGTQTGNSVLYLCPSD